jgi:hypothetical protein
LWGAIFKPSSARLHSPTRFFTQSGVVICRVVFFCTETLSPKVFTIGLVGKSLAPIKELPARKPQTERNQK